eukprot:jgi/Psemu1/36373/gm1.36373_g
MRNTSEHKKPTKGHNKDEGMKRNDKRKNQTEQNSGARQVFATLCKKVQTLRDVPKRVKILRK